MKFISIAAKNYRALEDVVVNFDADYCAISGHNNAGKSCLIRLIDILFQGKRRSVFFESISEVNFEDDFTQWRKPDQEIEIEYKLSLSPKDDRSLTLFINQFAGQDSIVDICLLTINLKFSRLGKQTTAIFLNGTALEDPAPREILGRLGTTNALFLHNSTDVERNIFFDRGRMKSLHSIRLSAQEQDSLQILDKQRKKKVHQFAKGHREQLNSMLGKLSERYEVAFAPMEETSGNHVPLRINLKNKNVQVPMDSWGSGTQNRTRILMSILQANNIKIAETSDEKTTPVVVIEEPECFLHPSAQAEFGSVLQDLAKSLEIQVIVSTHSPYMLNQANPAANVLLKRDNKNKAIKGTIVVDTNNDNWMEPFAEHLGICPPEFEKFRSLFSGRRSKVVLVEGELDKEYFHFITQNIPGFENNMGVEFLSYGGKDTLKNTRLIQFVLQRLDKCFITFDLDVLSDLQTSLSALNLSKGKNFLPIGIQRPGYECIEGLLPAKVQSAVFAQETALTMSLANGTSDQKKSAKSALKNKLLLEFKKRTDYSKDEMKNFFAVWKAIQRAL